MTKQHPLHLTINNLEVEIDNLKIENDRLKKRILQLEQEVEMIVGNYNFIEKRKSQLEQEKNELAIYILRQLRFDAEKLGFPDLARHIKLEELKIEEKRHV